MLLLFLQGLRIYELPIYHTCFISRIIFIVCLNNMFFTTSMFEQHIINFDQHIKDKLS